MAGELAFDVEAAIAALEAQKTGIDETIAALRRYQGLGFQGSGVIVESRAIDPASIPDDAFFGLSIGEAAKKYLGIIKRKQSIREIAEALDRGGLPHASGDFVATVATMLSRHAKKDGDLVRVGRGDWGLAAWYGNRRPAKQPATKSVVKKPKKSKRATGKGAAVLSNREMALEILRSNGAPMHIEALISAIRSKYGRPVLKDTLVGDLSRGVKKNEFVRPEPSVYGIAE